MESVWSVYILKCGDGTLYTGVTTDTARREKEHNSAKAGAKYTRARQPVKLIYKEACTDRSLAQKREAAIKKLSRKEKLLLSAS